MISNSGTNGRLEITLILLICLHTYIYIYKYVQLVSTMLLRHARN